MEIIIQNIYRYWVWPAYLKYDIKVPNLQTNQNIRVLEIIDDNTLLVTNGSTGNHIITKDMLKDSFYTSSINDISEGMYVATFGDTPAYLYQILSINKEYNICSLKYVKSLNGSSHEGFTKEASIGHIMIIPNNLLMNSYGVSNEPIKPNKLNKIFENSKYDLRLLEFYYDSKEPKQNKKEKQRDDVDKAVARAKSILDTRYGSKTERSDSKFFYSQYCLVVRETNNDSKRDFFTKIDGKRVYIKNKKCSHRYSLKIEEAVKQLCTVRIKETTESIRLFGHNTRKTAMLNSCIESKRTYEITKIIYDYKCKDDSVHDVVEVFDGELSLKFKLEELEIVLLSTKGISLPKDRTIKEGTECIIKNNKYLNVPKYTRVVVNRITQNRPSTGRTREDEFRGKVLPSRKDYLVVGTTDTGKQINCRIKHLKRL